MDDEWQITEAARSFLADVVEEFGRRGLGGPLYPSVMWSPEGQSGGSTPAPLAPEYSIGVYKPDHLPAEESFVHIPSDKFGLVVFLPRDEDLRSDRRTIDYDGSSIVVR